MVCRSSEKSRVQYVSKQEYHSKSEGVRQEKVRLERIDSWSTSPQRASRVPIETREGPQGGSIPEPQPPMMYKGWLLPSPPSLIENDGDDPPGYSNLASDFLRAPKPSKLGTQYVEWKTGPKNRKKKKKKRITETDDASCKSTTSTVVTEYGTMYVRRSRSSSSHSVAKENGPPKFRPCFSQSRYSKHQKFGALASYYMKKLKEADPGNKDDSHDELVAIKMNLSNLKEWAKKKRDPPTKKQVQFAFPLVSKVNYREKTLPEDIDLLYFHEDELSEWEEDRETTSSERFEVTIVDDEERVDISVDCRSYVSNDSHHF